MIIAFVFMTHTSSCNDDEKETQGWSMDAAQAGHTRERTAI
jgi:hypothetical protein